MTVVNIRKICKGSNRSRVTSMQIVNISFGVKLSHENSHSSQVIIALLGALVLLQRYQLFVVQKSFASWWCNMCVHGIGYRVSIYFDTKSVINEVAETAESAHSVQTSVMQHTCCALYFLPPCNPVQVHSRLSKHGHIRLRLKWQDKT